MTMPGDTPSAINASPARVPRLSPEEVTDPELQAVLERAEKLSTPKPEWYLTLGHAPQMAVEYARFWDLTHRGGRVGILRKNSCVSLLQRCSAAASAPISARYLPSSRGLTKRPPPSARCPTSITPIHAFVQRCVSRAP